MLPNRKMPLRTRSHYKSRRTNWNRTRPGCASGNGQLPMLPGVFGWIEREELDPPERG